jgi:hypothetical protein
MLTSPATSPSPSRDAGASATPTTAPTTIATTDVVRFAVVGDSITAGPCQKPDLPAAGPLSTCSWAGTLDALPGYRFVGGWARHGATTSQMAAAYAGAPTADVLLIAGGTNDLPAGIPWTQQRIDTETLASRAATQRVVLLALPPYDAYAASGAAESRNRQLAALAHEHGWGFVNPWTPYATSDYRWARGDSDDGIHPIEPVTQAAGLSIGRYLDTLVL